MKEISFITLLACTLACVVTAGAQQAPPPPADWQIEGKIQQFLREEHAFAPSTILSYLSKGTVKLTGSVHSEAEKDLRLQYPEHLQEAREEVAGQGGAGGPSLPPPLLQIH